MSSRLVSNTSSTVSNSIDMSSWKWLSFYSVSTGSPTISFLASDGPTVSSSSPPVSVSSFSSSVSMSSFYFYSIISTSGYNNNSS